MSSFFVRLFAIVLVSVCLTLGPIQANEFCSSDKDCGTIDPGTFCNCPRQSPTAGSCSSSGNYTCASKNGPETSCDFDAECLGFCKAGKCSNGLPNGEPCTRNQQCASLYCNQGKCDMGIIEGIVWAVMGPIIAASVIFVLFVFIIMGLAVAILCCGVSLGCCGVAVGSRHKKQAAEGMVFHPQTAVTVDPTPPAYEEA